MLSEPRSAQGTVAQTVPSLPTTGLHSLVVAAIAITFDGRGDTHDEQGHPVADQAELPLAQSLALEHPHHQEVELYSLEAHPAESGQEEVMQQSRHQAAAQPHLRGGGGATSVRAGPAGSALEEPSLRWAVPRGEGLGDEWGAGAHRALRPSRVPPGLVILTKPREWAELSLFRASPTQRSGEGATLHRAGPYLLDASFLVLDARQEDGGAHKEADAEVQVHGGARALDGPHQQEGENAQQQAD